MTDMNETHESALLAVIESQAARHAKTLRILLVCWLASLVLMGSLFVCLINSATEEETTTTTEVAQEADNYGNNVFTHGDYYGKADSKDN